MSDMNTDVLTALCGRKDLTADEARDALVALGARDKPLPGWGAGSTWYKKRAHALARLGRLVASARGIDPGTVTAAAPVWKLARLRLLAPWDSARPGWLPSPANATDKLLAMPRGRLVSAGKLLRHCDREWPMSAEELLWSWPDTRRDIAGSLRDVIGVMDAGEADDDLARAIERQTR